jgi:hypothetical protein
VRIWPEAIYSWGSTAQERAEAFPCDQLLPEADLRLFRAVDVAAEPATVFRWLCQLRAAPYSYDRLDNGGRRSPQRLTPGLEQLEPGLPVMRIFRLIAFESDRSMTLTCEGRLFGHLACTYRVQALTPGRSRLVVKLLVAPPAGWLGSMAMRTVLPAGDLVMMRRQLLNLKALAEATPEEAVSG